VQFNSWIARIFWFWYIVGLILMLFYRVPEALGFSNGLFLFFYAVYAASQLTGSIASVLRTAAAIGIAGFLLEWVGAATGYPFGGYRYSPTLGLAFFGVPLAIAAAWIAVVIQGCMLAAPSARALRACSAGGYAVMLDLVLDPVAHARGFWEWDAHDAVVAFHGVPWTNYAAWFAAAALFSLLVPAQDVARGERRHAARLYQAMLLMFGLLAVKEGLWGSAAVAACGLLWTEHRRRSM
jgi:uncharacterized membrane protein